MQRNDVNTFTYRGPIGRGFRRALFISKIARAFTLVELLVVIGIIALLVGLLMPALSRARAQANTIKCMANLRSLGQGLVQYSVENNGYFIPSFNMPPQTGATNYVAGAGQAMEGWPSILDRDGLINSNGGDMSVNTVFYCPDTYDKYGMASGQTGTNIGNPRGYIEWPMTFSGATGGDSDPQSPATMPLMGYTKIIRCSYWINSYNPIGVPSSPVNLQSADVYYTTSVGWGPDATGRYTTEHSTSTVVSSASTITLADGVYMGRQSADQIGLSNSRIGYRHRGIHGDNTAANIAFVDGHVETIDGVNFPNTKDNAATHYVAQQSNLRGPTIFANAPQFYGQ